MTVVSWSDFPALQALTCDPGCNPEKRGAWQNCTTSGINCLACSTKPFPLNRLDICNLMVSNLEFAQQWNSDIVNNFTFQTNGVFDFLKFRQRLNLTF